MTHDELVKIGEKYLRSSRHNVVIPACTVVLKDFHTAYGYRPDLIGFSSHVSVQVEVKASRSDFLADDSKPQRWVNGRDVGEFRYYLAPEGLISKEEVPEEWGLLTYDGYNVNLAKRAQLMTSNNYRGERTMLMSLLRRNKIKGN